jgi:predicted SAM-dependent methyltransferase
MKKIFKKFLSYLGFELKKITNQDDSDIYIDLYGSESVKNSKFYNISTGAFKGFGGGINHPCWTNIDVDKPWKNDKYFPGGVEYNAESDISHDLLSMKPIPVETATAELVHSRFTVDRLTDEAAQYFFNEVHRILKKGGIFRIVSTNLDLDFRAYKNNDKDYFFWLEDSISIEQAFLFHVVTQVSILYNGPSTEKISDEEFKQLLKTRHYEDALNYCVSRCSPEIHKNNRYDHFNWWNQKKYERMLSLAGFKTVYLSAPEQSASPVLRNNYYFDNEHIKVMMYMEAVKN